MSCIRSHDTELALPMLRDGVRSDEERRSRMHAFIKVKYSIVLDLNSKLRIENEKLTNKILEMHRMLKDE